MSLRIHITGASGSGTSTLGAALAARLDVPHFDTDDFFWVPSDPPYQVKRPIEERLSLMHAALRPRRSWTLSGSVDAWGSSLAAYFDRVVFLIAPTEIRLARLKARELARFGAASLAPGGAMHDNHEEFLIWAAAYDAGTHAGRSLPRHLAWLERLPCPVLRFSGLEPVDALVEKTLAAGR